MKKRFHKLLVLCMTAILAVTFLSLPALAAVPERPENQYVLDSAGVLSDKTEKKIVSKNQSLFRETGAQIVIAAVDFLGGDEIDDYAYDMFNAWGVGSTERNNGLLLVMAIGEDNYYAMAGYGIEDYFSGSKLQDLLDEYLEPDFAAGDYDAGAEEFFDAALSEMESYYRDYEDEYTAQTQDYTQGGTSYDYGSYDVPGSDFSIGRVIGRVLFLVVRVILVIAVVIVVIAVIRALTRGGGGGGTGTGGGGGGFWTGMFLGSALNRRRGWGYRPPPGGFGGPVPRPPRGGFGGFGGFGGGGHSGGFSGGGRSHGGGIGRSGGFHGGGGSRGGGAGRH